MADSKVTTPQTLIRLNGRDEMNLAEFPITLLTDRAPAGQKTLVFRDGEQTLTVTGSDKYGLPTALDADVIVGLLRLTKQANDFCNPTVEFTRYNLIQLLGWPVKGSSYARLTQSLKCWTNVTLNYEKAWWDNKSKRKIDATFHIIEEVVITDNSSDNDGSGEGSKENSKSTFTWNQRFFQSCRDDNLKKLDLDTYFSLASAITKRIYRFLDKRFYHKPSWTFNLHEFAYDHVGMGRNYTDNGKLKEKLQPALKKLENIGYLVPMSPKERYTQIRRGQWTITLTKRPGAEAKAELQAPAEEGVLDKELIARGVSASKAKLLAARYSPELISLQVEHADFLQESNPGKIKNLGGWLRLAIEQDYPTPPLFVSKAEKARREEIAREERRAGAEKTKQQKEATAREEAAKAQIGAYLEALSMSGLDELDREILADPEVKSRYDKQLVSMKQFPKMQRLYIESLRKDHVRTKLDLPPEP